MDVYDAITNVLEFISQAGELRLTEDILERMDLSDNAWDETLAALSTVQIRD